ncbi:hypothetical protein [Mesorhizobium sp. M0060]
MANENKSKMPEVRLHRTTGSSPEPNAEKSRRVLKYREEFDLDYVS